MVPTYSFPDVQGGKHHPFLSLDSSCQRGWFSVHPQKQQGVYFIDYPNSLESVYTCMLNQDLVIGVIFYSNGYLPQ